jgi:uncharacterized protein YciI
LYRTPRRIKLKNDVKHLDVQKDLKKLSTTGRFKEIQQKIM